MQVIGDRPEVTLDTILFATDLSEFSINAGEYALLLATQFGASVHIIHAFTISQAALEAESSTKRLSQQREELQHRLDSVAGKFAAAGVRVSTELVEGEPELTIPKLAEKQRASLLLLGTHGGNRFDRHTLGSVAERVLLHTVWPTLTVGPHAVPGHQVKVPLKRVLYATDLSDFAAQAAPYAMSLAEYFGAGLDILNVVPESSVKHPERWGELTGSFYRSLEKLVPDHAREFCDPRTFIEVGNAREQILRHIEEREIDLLVLGIHKNSSHGLQLRTSNVFHIILEARCPVLSIAG